MKFVPFELYEVMVTCESLLQTVAEVSAILHCVLYYALCVRTFMQKGKFSQRNLTPRHKQQMQ